jgi:hypothetical protein
MRKGQPRRRTEDLSRVDTGRVGGGGGWDSRCSVPTGTRARLEKRLFKTILRLFRTRRCGVSCLTMGSFLPFREPLVIIPIIEVWPYKFVRDHIFSPMNTIPPHAPTRASEIRYITNPYTILLALRRRQTTEWYRSCHDEWQIRTY